MNTGNNEPIRFANLFELRQCNICGKDLDLFDMQEDFTIHRRVGYGSKYDLNEIKICFCCGCFDRIVDSCKISPLIGECEF